MATITETKALNRLAQLSFRVGCPQDQLENFLRAGYVPQPRQLEFHAAARECDEPGGPTQIGFGGSRGPGKSHSLLGQMAFDDCQRRDGLKCLLLRRVGKAVRESFEDMRLRMLMGLPHEYRRSDGVLTFPNGSRIILGHFKDERDIDAYLGLEYDLIGTEEATTLSHTKYTAVCSCNRTSRNDWRPRCYNNANPGGVGHAWYKALFVRPYRAGTETETRFIPATIDDNVFTNPEYRDYLDNLTGWLKRAWRYGDWDISAGQFFSTFRHDVHVRAPFPIPKEWRVWASMDYGFVHPTVVHLHAQDGDGTIYTIAEHVAARWQVAQHAEAIKAMLDRWGMTPARLYTFVAGADVFAHRDDGPTVADKYRKAGFRLKPANSDRVNGWAELLARLGDADAGVPPRWFIFDACPLLVETLPMLEHDPHRPEDVLKVDVDDDGNGGDDAGDSARYGLMAAWTKRMKSGQVDWYAPKAAHTRTPQPARSQAEVEDMLNEYRS